MNRESQPPWLTPGQRVRVLPASSHLKIKELTIRSVEWPWLVSFEEEPRGCCHPNRILGKVDEP